MSVISSPALPAPSQLEAVAGPSDAGAPAPHPPARRFRFIDGLRGLAAMSVALYHLGPVGMLGDHLQAIVPAAVFGLLNHGHLGVPVFFVLSGFVIAYSQRGVRVTPRFLGNFALRRSIRLDPPYWATIILILILNAIVHPLRPDAASGFPGWRALAAHVLYIQDLVKVPQLNGAFWTLCYEVQFYLALTILTGVAQRLPFHGRALAGVKQGSRLIVFAPMTLLSLLVAAGLLRDPRGFFMDRWCAFFLGVLLWWVMERSVSVHWLWIFIIALIVATFIPARRFHENVLTGYWGATCVVTAIAIYAAGSLGCMDRWLSSRWIQFLGSISYSLYLVHSPIGDTLVNLGARLGGPSNVLAVGWIALAFFSSVGVAYLLYRFVERPAARLAKRLKQAPRAAVTDNAVMASVGQVLP